MNWSELQILRYFHPRWTTDATPPSTPVTWRSTDSRGTAPWTLLRRCAPARPRNITPHPDPGGGMAPEREAQSWEPIGGLTWRENEAAAGDPRRCFHWLEQEGYTKLG